MPPRDSDLLLARIRFNEFERVNKKLNEDEFMLDHHYNEHFKKIKCKLREWFQQQQLISNKFNTVIGDILVGKKTGEGVFGVSFKVKGPPKKLETSVNPIKTLTPRFITRTLEKIKKN